jgi:hypothetical protein
MTTNTEPTLLQAALSYAARGWPVFPLRSRTKLPFSNGDLSVDNKGKEGGCKVATTDPALIREWWQRWPQANIGIATGRRAGFWVLDVDDKPEEGKHGPEELASLIAQHGPLPSTAQQITGGGGRQLFFAWPATGAEIRNTTDLAGHSGLDVRGEGGYIVAPPSIHPRGTPYTWEVSSDPFDDVAIADPPTWLLEMVQARSDRQSRPIPQRGLQTWGDEVAKAARALQQLAPERCDDYTDWVTVGMALRELGAAGFELWDQWSQRSSKYEPGECERKWRSFTPGNGVTLGSLFHMARKDSPSALQRLSEPRTAQDATDSGGIGDDFSPGSFTETLEGVEDAIEAYDLAGQFAELPASEYAKAKAVLKERLGAALNLNDLDRAVNEARRSLRRWEASLEVIIVTDRPLRDISTDGLQALIKANEPPVLFVRSGKLVRVRADEKGQPLIEELSESTLRGRLARVSDWARVTENGERHCPPPLEVVRDLLALGAWPFPALEAITEAPCLRPDGTILEQPGYDPATQLVYWPAEGLTVPSVPTTPTNEDVARALDLWHEATEGFPFVDDAARANALALALTPILRPAIAGKVPLALIDAPQAGTGKGLLFELITMITTGRPASMMNAPDSDEEWRKAITSHLLTGTTMIGIDNVERPLNAPALAMALTAPIWKDRLLGRNEAVSLPQRATWVATGNNLRLGLDLPRRCYWIRLDAKMARPWQREQFKHPDLIRWATQERGNLLWALLTLARSWYAAGQPAPDVRPIGSFEDWTRTVGGVLQHAGIKGFLGNLEEMYAKADEDGPEWYEFLSAWYQELGDRTLTISQLMKHLSEGQALREALPDDLASAMTNPNGSFQKRLGHALKSRVDKRYGDEGLHVERASDEKRAKVARWRVRSAGFAGFCGESTTQSQANPPPLVDIGENDKGGVLYEQWPTRTPQNPANPATPEQQWEEIGDEPQEPGGTFRINMTTGKRERLRQGPGNAAEPTEPCRLCGKTDWIWSPAGYWVCGTCPPVAVAAEG